MINKQRNRFSIGSATGLARNATTDANRFCPQKNRSTSCTDIIAWPTPSACRYGAVYRKTVTTEMASTTIANRVPMISLPANDGACWC